MGVLVVDCTGAAGFPAAAGGAGGGGGGAGGGGGGMSSSNVRGLKVHSKSRARSHHAVSGKRTVANWTAALRHVLKIMALDSSGLTWNPPRRVRVGQISGKLMVNA